MATVKYHNEQGCWFGNNLAFVQSRTTEEMTDPHRPNEIAIYNDRSLQTTIRAIALSQGHFSLILVRCNYAALQAQMVARLKQLCREDPKLRQNSLVSVVLPPTATSLYTPIREALSDKAPSAVIIFGLDSAIAIPQLLASSNQVRDEFRKNFPFPLVLWVTEEVLASLIRFAPDFKSWAATSIKFEMPTQRLLELLEREARDLLERLLLTLSAESGYQWCHPSPTAARKEIESALKDLHSRGVILDPDLEASVQFVLGRDDFCRDRLDSAFTHYQHSLRIWQPRAERELAELSPQPPEETQNLASYPSRWGILLFHLALLHCRNAQLHQAQSQQHWQQARDCLQQCIDIFVPQQQPSPVANFLPLLCEVLTHLEQWDELQQQAEKGLHLHQHQPVQLARDYGFLAQVAQARHQWDPSKKFARSAIETLAAAPIPQRQDRGLYLYLLARAMVKDAAARGTSNRRSPKRPGARSHLLASQEVISILHLARVEADPARDPQLYLSILKLLRSLYFDAQNYLEAFHIKLELRAIETLYGFRAFIGAGLLQPQTASPSDPKPPFPPPQFAWDDAPAPPQVLAAAGRQQDVERLLERMNRADKKLTILYGDSGVGKSSLVHAGLVPALQRRSLGDRIALPIIVRSYTDWMATLSRDLQEAVRLSFPALAESQPHTDTLPESESTASAAIAQLRRHIDRNLIVVLIFDQFEEFFFVNKSPQQRREFYDFLKTCLDIPFVKVILSLRTDFLYYLLECERFCELDAINNDILSKEIRYHLADFSQAQAREVINTLTQRSQFYLESELIDALVKDLSSEIEQVRPIELQLVGAQLQDEEEPITTLERYQQLGENPKEILIGRSLVQVVRDCGPQQEKNAWELLYGLTDEKNTRPLKTKEELAIAANMQGDKLDSILQILEGAGLVFIHREESGDRYQLVHDYLVYPVRQKYETDFGPEARLLKAEEAKKMTQVELEKSNQILKHQRGWLAFAVLMLAVAGTFALVKKEQANISVENAQITAISASSEALFVSNREFDALMESLRAWRELKQAQAPDAETKIRVIAALQQAVYGVKERNRLEGHGAEVWSVNFSPDGELIVSGGNDNKVQLWNRNGKKRATFVDPSLPDDDGISHAQEVTSVSFSPNSQLIASASRDRTVKLWHRDGTLLHTLTGHQNSVYSVSFSPDGKLVASASHDKTIKLWRTSDGSLVNTLVGHGESVNWVTFSPDGAFIASASDDKTVKLWRRDGTLARTFPPHEDWVTVVVFSPDGTHLVSAGVDRTIRVTPLNGTGAKSWKAHEDMVFSLSFSPDGEFFASASDDNTIKLWKLDGTLVKTLQGHSGRVTTVNFSPDGTTLASASFDKTVRLWRLKDKDRFLKMLAGQAGHQSRVTSVSFSPDGESIASGSWDNTVKLWHPDGTGDAEEVMTLSGPDGHTGRVFRVSFSPVDPLIASASQDCTVKIWSSRDGRLLKTLVDPSLGDAVASEDCGSLQSHSDRIYAVSFSPDGQYIASGSRDRMVKIWRLDGTLVKTLEGHGDRVNSVAFSPRGNLLASASDDRTVKLWSLDGRLLQTLAGSNPHQSYVTSVTFSPDGQLVASASWDNTVKIWNLDGSLAKTLLQGYSDSVESVTFSPDGRLLASASWDNTVKLWSLKDGTLLKTLQGHTSGVLDVTFSPDGKTIASAGDDHAVILWNLDLEDLTRRACTWLHDYLQYSNNISSRDRTLCEETLKEQRFQNNSSPNPLEELF